MVYSVKRKETVRTFFISYIIKERTYRVLSNEKCPIVLQSIVSKWAHVTAYVLVSFNYWLVYWYFHAFVVYWTKIWTRWRIFHGKTFYEERNRVKILLYSKSNNPRDEYLIGASFFKHFTYSSSPKLNLWLSFYDQPYILLTPLASSPKLNFCHFFHDQPYILLIPLAPSSIWTIHPVSCDSDHFLIILFSDEI